MLAEWLLCTFWDFLWTVNSEQTQVCAAFRQMGNAESFVLFIRVVHRFGFSENWTKFTRDEKKVRYVCVFPVTNTVHIWRCKFDVLVFRWKNDANMMSAFVQLLGQAPATPLKGLNGFRRWFYGRSIKPKVWCLKVILLVFLSF